MMRNNLLRTFLYGSGAMLGLHILFQNSGSGFLLGLVLVLVTAVVFVVAEVLPRKKYEASDSKSQMLDKILLFILLALSGIGLLSIRALIDLLYIHPLGTGDYRVFALIFLGPLALIYGIIALVVILRLYARRAGISIVIPPTTNRRLVMFILAAFVSDILKVTLYEFNHATAWSIINSGVIGLVIYEILYRTHKWLNFKTLIIYVFTLIPIINWINALLYSIESNSYDYSLSLAPFTDLFSAEYFPFNLYWSIETIMVAVIAYWIIQTHGVGKAVDDNGESGNITK